MASEDHLIADGLRARGVELAMPELADHEGFARERVVDFEVRRHGDQDLADGFAIPEEDRTSPRAGNGSAI